MAMLVITRGQIPRGYHFATPCGRSITGSLPFLRRIPIFPASLIQTQESELENGHRNSGFTHENSMVNLSMVFFVNVCQRVCLVILASKIASTGGKPNAINFNQLWTDCRKRSHTNGDFGDGILVGFSDDLTLLGLDMS